VNSNRATNPLNTSEEKMELIKSKKRVKDLGEVFTPPFLVDDMLNALPPDAWEPGKTFLEPSCGNGNFLVEVARRKVLAGASPMDALRTIYAIDIMEDNVVEARQRVLTVLGLTDDPEAHNLSARQIVVGDSLKQTLEELFPAG
jgi:2-polyprenyl-3-methyl-5-hydroxy-6-metoxy-1,4-benzoquinol methylase